ncbi:MAG: hypothetical protein DHS20C18_22980 [Saprospiraceae bacterium]|nr:MAG: hypothetical protein DHS20C18_22980 [Saprospiraceae bacterium]
MKAYSIKLLIGASIVALIALLYFQIKWMDHSRHLMEEQFKNRVQMALCSAVEKAANNTDCQALRASCGLSTNQATCRLPSATLLRTSSLDSAIAKTLNYYQLDIPYEVQIVEKSDPDSYSCSLEPLLETDQHYLGINFPNKSKFLLNGMNFMFVSSIAILLFISFLFALASYYLLRQKRISDLNRDFFNHMAHEFRTPLTNIKLASGLLQKQMPAAKESRYLQIINGESAGLMEQVEKVLHLSQIERKEYQLHKELTDLQGLIQQVIKEMDLQIKEKSAKLDIQLPAEPINYAVDRFHFSRLLRNLLDNALKYSTGIPLIRVNLKDTREQLQFQIADNGPGLKVEQQQQAFNKFSRFQSDVKGFGLGLAYVKKIVELHGGQITLGSSSNNQGTSIQFQLPKHP